MIVSLGKIDLKYFIYLIVYFAIQIYSNYILYQYSKKIEEHRLLEIFLTNFGYLLIIIPALITKKFTSSDLPKKKLESEKNNENSTNLINKNENDSNNNNIKIKDIIIFFSVCILNLFVEFSYILVELLNGYYKEEYFLFETLIWFIAPKFIFKKTYYKHQKIAILLIIIIGAIKAIITMIVFDRFNYKQLLLEIFIHSGDAIFYGYMKALMEFKYFSPFQCCYIFGIVNTPIILIAYFIVSYIPCNNKFLCDGKEYFDNIYSLFDNFSFNELIFLILECLSEGIGLLSINMIMNKFTLYHALIPFHATFCVINLLDNETSKAEVIITSIYFIAEIIFILVFLEIIELNFCNLNKNLKRKIEDRAINEDIYNETDEEQIVFVDEEKKFFINTELPMKK